MMMLYSKRILWCEIPAGFSGRPWAPIWFQTRLKKLDDSQLRLGQGKNIYCKVGNSTSSQNNFFLSFNVCQFSADSGTWNFGTENGAILPSSETGTWGKWWLKTRQFWLKFKFTDMICYVMSLSSLKHNSPCKICISLWLFGIYFSRVVPVISNIYWLSIPINSNLSKLNGPA